MKVLEDFGPDRALWLEVNDETADHITLQFNNGAPIRIALKDIGRFLKAINIVRTRMAREDVK